MKTLFAVFSLALLSAMPADTVEELIAKNLAAHGGEARLRALKSMRLCGKVLVGAGEGFEARFGMLCKRPGKVRVEMTLQGLTEVSAWDGREGWQVQPFGGRREPERMSADDARELAQQDSLEPLLLVAKDRGYQIESLGTEDVDGSPAHKLRVRRKDGDVQYVFLDPDSMLEIRITTVHKVRGVEQFHETDLGNYAQVGGLWVPMSIESGEQGKPRSSRLTIERAELDVAADDALFSFPPRDARVERAIVADPAAAAPAAGAPPAGASKAAAFDSGVLSGLGARNIGSAAMSGRVSAVAAAHAGGKTTLFVGASSGGVWRSPDAGTTFKPVFDKQAVQSIGAIAIDPRDPGTVWVGTGEAWTRNSASVGDGIYKSTDSGTTWTHMGLRDSERIARIVVHPKDGNTVFAAVPGRLWSDSDDRGVYRTSDGGKTWSLVLRGSNASTGCSSLAMDPGNPDVLLAGMWDFRRKGWTFRSGGDGPDAPSGSGLWRSEDGGRTWGQVDKKTAGLPDVPWGRVEVVFAPSNGKVAYALIESKASALYRSADGGRTWEQRDNSQMMVWRPFYFARLIVDPTNPDRLFKPDLTLVVSEDGGRSFSPSGGGAHGDWHDLWIDPADPSFVVGGDDGGLWLSRDGGSRWWKANNLPISQFYHVSVDDRDPYQVYGGLQDNSSWVGRSQYPGGITNAQWENLYNGDGFWVLVDPTDPEAVYAESQGGYLGRVDRNNLTARDIQPKAGLHEKLRFNWNTPIALSPTNRGTLYLGAQFLFRTRDRGESWERISPDLTTNDPAKQKQEESGGVTVDNSSAEMHTTIYSISESPRDPQTIWVGTDDGNLQLTRDGGGTWTELAGNVAGLPARSWVSWVEASRYDPATAYVAFDRHTSGDLDPWVFQTTDAGRSWTRIAAPAQGVRGYAHVIKEDTIDRNLLFLGTEFGLWISIDGGAAWAKFEGGSFPSVAVRDLALQARENDLVIATHGRGIWIVDDLTPLRGLTPEKLKAGTTFLPERPCQQRLAANGGWANGDAAFLGDNPPAGATITYYLRNRHVYGELKLEILDPDGKLVDTLPATKRRGINRVTWSMSVEPPEVPRAAGIAQFATQGPRVVPGTYKVRLTNGAEVVEGPLEIVLDARARYSVADRKQQFAAVMKAHALFGEMSRLLARMEAVRTAVAQRAAALREGDEPGARLRALAARTDELRRKIVATKEGGAITGEERIREHLDLVYGALLGHEGRPAQYQVDRVEVLRTELNEVAAAFADLLGKDLPPIDAELRQHGFPAIGPTLPPK